MTRTPTLYLVCYDIRCNKRGRQVYEVMREFGEHLQYSVFRCVLSARHLAELRARLFEVIATDADQVLIVPLGAAGAPRTWRVETLGVSVPAMEHTVRCF